MKAFVPATAALIRAGIRTPYGATEASWTAWSEGARHEPRIPADPLAGIEMSREQEAQARLLNGAGRLLAAAAYEALHELPARWMPEDDGRRGFYLLQVDAGNWDCHDFTPALHLAAAEATAGATPAAPAAVAQRSIKPYFLLEGLRNNAMSFLSAWFGFRGANTGTSGGAGTGALLLDLAIRALARNDLDLAAWGGGVNLATAVAHDERRRLRASEERLAELPLRGDGAAVVVLARDRADAQPPVARLAFRTSGRTALPSVAHPYPATAADWEKRFRAAAADRVAPLPAVAVVAAGVGGPRGESAVREGLAAAGVGQVPLLALDRTFGDAGGASEALGLALLVEGARRGACPHPEAGTASTSAALPWPRGTGIWLACGGDGGLSLACVVRA